MEEQNIFTEEYDEENLDMDQIMIDADNQEEKEAQEAAREKEEEENVKRLCRMFNKRNVDFDLKHPNEKERRRYVFKYVDDCDYVGYVLKYIEGTTYIFNVREVKEKDFRMKKIDISKTKQLS